jgi:uncharacterized lipoprotein YddW (UPF0748 family)
MLSHPTILNHGKQRLWNLGLLVLGFIFCFSVFSFSGAPFRQATPPTKMAIRGVWAHPGFFGLEKDAATAKIRATLDGYVQAGINTVIILVKSTSGHVYFQSQIAVQDPAYNWDFFGVFFDEAKKRNISVHPWFCVFPESAVLGRVREHPEWLIMNDKGEMTAAANAALPQVREYEISLMLELLKRYPVDWVHLDYIRFPCSPEEPYFSFDAQTRSLFEKAWGQDPLALKAKDSGNLFWNEWIEWNGGQVTQFVRDLREAVRVVGRPVKISAAVFPAADKAKVLIGQDWEEWVKQGLIDMLCPMLYTNHHGLFEKYARRAVEIGRGRVLVCPGIGIGTSHNQNTPAGMWEQMNISQRLGGNGVIFFSSSSLTESFLQSLRSGRAPAAQ